MGAVQLRGGPSNDRSLRLLRQVGEQRAERIQSGRGDQLVRVVEHEHERRSLGDGTPDVLSRPVESTSTIAAEPRCWAFPGWLTGGSPAGKRCCGRQDCHGAPGVDVVMLRC